MYLAFAAIHSLITTALPRDNTLRTKVPTCQLDPSRPVEPSRNLSATDRKYLSKVKAKFLNARRVAEATRSGDFITPEDNTTIPIIPDDLDEMEDVIFDRRPENIGQAKLFGAWLDEAVAGRKAGTTVTSSHHDEDAEVVFSKAMNIFGRGMYKQAMTLFAQAAHLAGPETRLGGQYQLWQAQAFDAAGDKQQATQLFATLFTHSDAEVRKVSQELSFIITAPKIPLNENSFLKIPDIDDAKSPLTPSLLNSNSKSSFNTSRVSQVEKSPKPHSLQWYLDKEKPRQVADHSTTQAVAVAVAIIGTLAFMAVSPL